MGLTHVVGTGRNEAASSPGEGTAAPALVKAEGPLPVVPETLADALKVAFQSILPSPVAALVVSTADFSCFANRAFCTLHCNTAGSDFVQGANAQKVFGARWSSVKSLLLGVVAGRESVSFEEVLAAAATYPQVRATFHCSPLTVEDGAGVLVMVIADSDSLKVRGNEQAGLSSQKGSDKDERANLLSEDSPEFRKALLEAQNNAIPDALLVVDTRGKILSFNKHFETIWRMPRGITDSKDDYAALAYATSQVADPEAFRSRVDYLYANSFESAREEIALKDGRVLERYGNAVLTEDGKNLGWAWYFRDITEQKTAEEDTRAIFDNAAVGIAQLDLDGNWLRVNGKLCEIVGYTKPELLELSFHQITHPDDLQKDLALVERMLCGEIKNYSLQKRYLRKNGREVWINLTVSLVRKPDGTPRYFVSIVEDIDEKKRIEQDSRLNQARFRSAFMNAAIGMALTDTRGRFVKVNKAYEKLTGYTQKELTELSFTDINHPDDNPRNSGEISDLLTGKTTSMVTEKRYLKKNGETVWVRVSASVVKNKQGEVENLIGLAENTTEERLVRQKLQQSEELFRHFSNNITNLAWIADGAGWIFWYNQRWFDYTDTTLEEMQGWGWQKVHHPDHADRVVSFVKEAWQKGEPFELIFPLRRFDGEYRWFLTRAVPVKNETGHVHRWIGTNTDIHEQVEAEAALKRSEEQLKLLSEFMPQMVWAANAKGHRDYFNTRWLEFTGLSEEQLRTEGWLQVIHSDDVDRTRDAWAQCVQSGDYYEIENRVRRKDGEYRWVLARATPFMNEAGEVIRWFGTSTDIHDQKTIHEELDQLVKERTKELHRSNADLQQFAHVASHDMKEPVRKVRIFSNRLKEEYGSLLTGDGIFYLDKIESAAERMHQMIEGVLHYSTITSERHKIEPVSIVDLIKDIETDLEVPIAQKKAVIETGDLPVVAGSKMLLYQLFYNLINNSLKFSKKDVSPVIRIYSVTEEVRAENTDISVLNGFVAIRLEDNGIGFNPEMSEKIFQTFTRLNARDKYEGTGLGLALCKKIVEEYHRGSITAAGKPGEGAVFTMLLPGID